MYAHSSHFISEILTEDCVTVPQEVAGELIEQESVAQLLAGPFGGWLPSHVAVNYAATIMGKYQEDVENMKADRRNREEVDGNELRDVVLKERTPSLRGRLANTHHIFGHAGLANVDTEFEQLAMNARCSPCGILATHLANQIADFTRNGGTARLAVANFPGPEKAKGPSMPGHDRFGFHYDQRRAPVSPDARQANPEQAISRGQFGSFLD